MNGCVVRGCSSTVSRPGHKLCKAHWTAEKAGKLIECPGCKGFFERALQACPQCCGAPGQPTPPDGEAAEPRHLSSTKLGVHFELSAQRMNLVLAELGWIEKYTKGWKPTPQGLALGGEGREARQSGVPYVVWPNAILSNRALRLSIGGEDTANREPAAGGPAPRTEGSDGPGSGSSAAEFRAKFPPTMRTKDGHMVRSRGEVLIDNFLYDQGHVHSYERRLPIEEDVFSDFYLPRANLYIEYWGLEGDRAYEARKTRKLSIYREHGLRLVEVQDSHIASLDDELPKLLLKFGVDCT